MTYPPADAAFFARRINQDGLDLIKQFEGLHVTPYLCPARIGQSVMGIPVPCGPACR